MNATPPARSGSSSKDGMVMFVVLGGLGLLALIGLTTLAVLRTDYRINRNHRNVVASFYDADAGVNYVKQKMEERLTAGQTLEQIRTSMNVPAPAGFFFETVTQLRQLSDTNVYSYSVVGHAGPVGTPAGQARTVIEAAVRQSDAVTLGIFGTLDLRLQPNVDIFSYDSRVTPNPTAASSTGQASVGSNESIIFQPNVTLDGSVAIGADSSGSPAACAGCGPYNTMDMGYIEPDPLGATGGSLAAKFIAVSTVNNNASSPDINGARVLDLWNKNGSLSAGNYYLSSVRLKGDLVIDATGGPVNIYLTGGWDSWPGSEVNVLGNPTDFRIYSNSDQEIEMLPRTDFRGYIYAPRAHVQLQPNGKVLGAVWSKSVTLQPGGDVFIDTAILSGYKTTRLVFTSWKEVR